MTRLIELPDILEFQFQRRIKGIGASKVSRRNISAFCMQFDSRQHTEYSLCDLFPLATYRVEQKSWCQVQRIVLPSQSQPRPAMPGCCLTKQSLFYAQRCTVDSCAISGLVTRVVCQNRQSKWTRSSSEDSERIAARRRAGKRISLKSHK